MKFLCPSCKAKYQIADEKIAGRSVRMKCRKCGFIIPISDVPPAPETMAPSDGDLLSRSMVPRAPARPAWIRRRPGRTKCKTPLRPRVARARRSPRPRSLRLARALPLARRVPHPPVRAAFRRAPPLLLRQDRLLPRRVPQCRPRPPRARSRRRSRVRCPPIAVAYDTDEDEATRVATAAMGGLDTGFKAIVNKEPPPESVGMPADEWFVGVNGSPIGPIRLSDLRAKAASGAVTLESLVWRDGYEEWRPLKTFPELVAVVEESLSNVRASMTPFVPSRPSAPSPSTSIAPKPAPVEAKPVSSSSDVTAPITATAAPAQSPTPAPASTAVTGSALVTDEIAMPRQRMPFAAMAAIAVALALGLTLGFVIFSGQSEPVVQYVQVPASAAPAALTPALENAAPAPPPVATTEEGEEARSHDRRRQDGIRLHGGDQGSRSGRG